MNASVTAGLMWAPVLRIKELDAVCVVTTAPRRLDPEILARRAR